MAHTTIEHAEQEYIKQYGEVNKDAGYRLQSNYSNCGVLIHKCYRRNEFNEDVEDIKLFKGGNIYHPKSGKILGTYTELQ